MKLNKLLFYSALSYAAYLLIKGSSKGIFGDESKLEPIYFSKKIEKKYGITLDLLGSLKKGDLNLSKIVVPKEKRNKGLGEKVMQEIVDYADKNNKRVTLTPSSDFGGNVKRLKNFYKKFGFVENKGTNKDFSTKETMYRVAKVFIFK